MTEAEQKLLDAAREHWITGKYNHLIAAVNAERTNGDVLVWMSEQEWRWLTNGWRWRALKRSCRRESRRNADRNAV